MTANTNQPNRGNQGNPGSTSRTGAQDSGQQGLQSQGSDEGRRFGSSASQQGFQGGEDATRCLDAIEENVAKLRNALSGSERTSASERESRSGRTDRQSAGRDDDRFESGRIS